MTDNTNIGTEKKTLSPKDMRYGTIILVFALITTVLMPVIILGSASFVPKLFFAFSLSGVYAAVLSSKLIPAVKFLPVISSAVSVAIHAFNTFSSKNPSGIAFIGITVIFTGFVLNSSVLSLCASKKASKTEFFIASSVCALITGLLEIVCAFIYSFGHFSPSLVREKLSLVFSSFSDIYSTAFEQITQTSQFNEALQMYGIKDFNTDEFLKLANQYVQTFLESVRISLPALIILFAMFFAAVCMLLYTASVGFASKRSLMGTGYFEYTVSGFSARVYNTILFIAMLGTFIGLPSMALIVCVNLLMILIFPLSHIGIRQFYRILKTKKLQPFLAVLITGTAVLMILFFAGPVALLAFAFAGVFFTMSEEIKHQNP